MIYKFNVPLFNAHVRVFLGDSEKQNYSKACFKMTGKHAEFVGSKAQCCGSYIWMQYRDLGTLAHELTHFVDEFCSHFGIEEPSNEVRAYVMGWLVETIWKKMEVK